MSNYTDDDIHALMQRISHLEQQGVPGVRDFFATSALSVLGNDVWIESSSTDEIATFCYNVADAMMIEREKNAVAK